MMEEFKFDGPNGKHIGMVFELMGVDLLKVMKWYNWEGIPLPLVRIMAKQVLTGLYYLHEHCEVIHTDIKPENILLVPTSAELMKHIRDVPDHFKSHIKQDVQPSQFYSKEQNHINRKK